MTGAPGVPGPYWSNQSKLALSGYPMQEMSQYPSLPCSAALPVQSSGRLSCSAPPLPVLEPVASEPAAAGPSTHARAFPSAPTPLW